MKIKIENVEIINEKDVNVSLEKIFVPCFGAMFVLITVLLDILPLWATLISLLFTSTYILLTTIHLAFVYLRLYAKAKGIVKDI